MRKKSEEEQAMYDALIGMGVTMECSTPSVIKRTEHFEFMFHITLKRNDRQFWAGPFYYGCGHVDMGAKMKWGTLGTGMDNEELKCYEMLQRKPGIKFLPEVQHIVKSMYQKLALKQKLTASIEGVVYCLLSDGSAAIDGMTFPQWCSDLGYSDDSISAKATYDACVQTGFAMQSTFSKVEIERLRNFQI